MRNSLKLIMKLKQKSHQSFMIHTLALVIVLAASDSFAEPQTDIKRYAASGWDALWNNSFSVAQQMFRLAVTKNERDIWARRGLVLADLASGNERDALDQLAEISRINEADGLDFLLAMWVYNSIAVSGDDEKLFLKICRRLSTKESVGPLDRRPMLEAMIAFGISRGKASLAESRAKELNRITSWSILGPFDNTSGSGHAKNFLVASNAFDRHAIFRGKAAQKFNWHYLRILSRALIINFANHFEIAASISAYAGCAFIVEKPGPYILSFSCSGSIVAQLDGEEILNVKEISDHNEYYHFEVRVNPGRHNLLVKVSGDDTPPKLAVSLSRIDGEKPKDAKFSSLIPMREGTGLIEARPVQLLFINRILSMSSEHPHDITAAFWKLLSLWYFGRNDSLRSFALEADGRFPKSSIMHYAIASAMSDAGDESSSRQFMLKAVKCGPYHAQSAIWQAKDMMKRRMYNKSDSILTTIIEKSKGAVAPRILLMESYWDRGIIDKAIPIAEELRMEFQGFSEPLDILSKYYESLGNKDLAKMYSRKSIEAMPKTNKALYRVVKAMIKDDPKSAEKQLKILNEIFPDSPTLMALLARTMIRNGKHKGLYVADKAALYFPYSSVTQLLKADLEYAKSVQKVGSMSKARRFYERVVELSPGNFDARNKIREIDGKKRLSELLPSTDLERLRQSEVSADAYPGAAACVLLDEDKRIIFDDGANYMERVLLIKIFSQEGVEQFSTMSMEFNPLLSDVIVRSARTIKPDGREIEARIMLGKVAFESLGPGDVIELNYSTSLWVPGQLNREFWDSHIFQWSAPCRISRYTILTPKGLRLQWVVHNTPSGVVINEPVREIEEFAKYTWTMKNVPERPNESFMPSPYDVSPWLDISSIDSWEKISNWYSDLSEEPSRENPVVALKTKELIKGLRNDHDKVEQLYEFVANQITYQDLLFSNSAIIPRASMDVLRSRFGDCKDKVCLLRSMLKSIGIQSYFVLVSPVQSGTVPRLPSPRFTHAILAIPRNEDLWLMDPTARGMPADCLPMSLQGTSALIIKPGTSELTMIPISTSNREWTEINTSVTVKENGSYQIRRSEVNYIGEVIADIRNNLCNSGEGERQKYVLRDLASKIVGVRLEECSWSGLSQGSDSVEVRYVAEVDNALKHSGQMGIATPPWKTEIDRYLGSIVAIQERHCPLALYGLRVREDETLSMVFPLGWKIISIPESKEFSCPYGYGSFSYKRAGNRVEMKRKLAIAGVIMGKEYYDSFKLFLENVIREHESAILIRR